jgi:hypothetical protein
MEGVYVPCRNYEINSGTVPRGVFNMVLSLDMYAYIKSNSLLYFYLYILNIFHNTVVRRHNISNMQ